MAGLKAYSPGFTTCATLNRIEGKQRNSRLLNKPLLSTCRPIFGPAALYSLQRFYYELLQAHGQEGAGESPA